MAEVLGAVASGIGIAQFAGGIIKTSFRIKSLLEDIKNVPEDLQRHLAQIQLLAPLLAEIDHGHSISNGALLAAADQCRQAALELDVLATDLSQQVNSSRGLGRRIRSIQIVLQKSTITRHEKRVQATIQMLTLALQLTSFCRQNELIQLQQSQPGIIAAEVAGSLVVASTVDNVPKRGLQTTRESNEVEKRHDATSSKDRTMFKKSDFLRTSRSIGVEWLTGTIAIQTSDYTTSDNDQERGTGLSGCRVRVTFPRWLSERALESFLYKDSWSWKHILTPYSVRDLNSTIGDQLIDIAFQDDLEGLRRLLQSGHVSLGDRLLERKSIMINESKGTSEDTTPTEYNLLSFMLGEGAWRISNYLEEQGVETVVDCLGRSVWHKDDAKSYHLRSLLQKLDSFFFQQVSLANYVGTINEFRILRQSSVWPDALFLRDDFAYKRVKAAWQMIEAGDGEVQASIQAERARDLLFYKGSSYCASLTDATMNKLIGTVEFAIGIAVGTGCAAETYIWTEFWLELTRAGLNRKYLYDRPSEHHGVMQGLQISSWIFALLYGVRRGMLHTFNFSYLFRKFGSSINEAIGEYLRMLQTCGVDLTSPKGGRIPPQEYSIWTQGIETPFFESRDVTMYCMGITYGPNSEDWKFWIADDTESYAGDFWELVDPRPLWIPGGWIEEDMMY